ncbi:MAG: thioredoxin-disulfide reductase [Bacteroidales bacterium]|jgi:thioredoxin reductase (NADPH)|nr:thioredoxin-disulfide reductase [Bacteroidales bacterium]
METRTKCLIIGSGPAGYTASIYASRAGLQPVVYQGFQAGGQLTITTEVENFPGFATGIQGPQLMDNMYQQALRLGADIRYGEILSVDFSRRPFICMDENGDMIVAQTVIIATGASARWLGLDSEQKFKGYGVSACATCDGFFYRDKTVAVVGGGDTACEEATYLATLCKKVYLIHRRDSLRASKFMQKRVMETPNIEILWNYVPIEILGKEANFDKEVTGICLQNTVNQSIKSIELEGVFIAIGHHPNTEIFEGQIAMDEHKYILTSAGSSCTNIEGVFAAGDVMDTIYKQAITAAASGCKAAIDAEKYLLNLAE